MITPPTLVNEFERLSAVQKLKILDTVSEERFDRITRLALQLFNVPIALISLEDADRQWFKSCRGLSISEIPRAISFCSHALSNTEPMIVPDALLDPRFADNPLVTGDPFVRFYAGQPLLNPDGLPIGTFCIVDREPKNLNEAEQQSLRDLATLVETELNTSDLVGAIAELQKAESEVHFQAYLLDMVQQAVIATDVQGNISYWNKFAEQLYGWPKTQVLGQNIVDVISAPTVREQHNWELESHATLEVVRGEYLSRKRDGTIFPIQAVSTPLLDENGNITGIVGVSNDISERKQVEEALQVSEERFRALIENSADMIALIAADGKVIYQSRSAERVIGYSSQDWASGKISLETIHPDDIAVVLKNFEELKRTPGTIHTATFRLKHKKDDSWHFIEATGQNLLEQKAVGAIVVNARDVTSRYAAEEKLRQQAIQLMQAQKMEAVGRLTGGIAHDFNNLMTAIQGYTELLLAQTPAPNPQFGDLTDTGSNSQYQDLLEIKHTAERATALTRQLLAFSRKQVLRPQIINIGELVINLTNMLQRLIGEDIDLETKIDPDLVLVRADPSQLEQIMVNLIVNARDAMPDGGLLEINVTNQSLSSQATKEYSYKVEPGNYVCLKVRDNGEGMNQETLSHIFEPFYTTKPVDKGTGLGLATVYGIVKQSDGFITVESTPGLGTTFHIYLPQYQPTPDKISLETDENNNSISYTPNEYLVETILAASTSANANPSLGTTLSSASPVQVSTTSSLATSTPFATALKTILIVEDENKIRELLTRSLTAQKLQVLTAANGHEALAQIQTYEGRVDLILTDVVLPDMRGPEIVSKLRQFQPQMKVILMSGYSEEAVVEQGQLVKGAVFLEKPFNLSTLLQKIREALS